MQYPFLLQKILIVTVTPGRLQVPAKLWYFILKIRINKRLVMNPEQTPTPTPEPTPSPTPTPTPTPGPSPSSNTYPTPPSNDPINGAAATNPQAGGENPDKNFLVALALSYLLGSFGADRIYLGKTGTAIAKFLTFGGLGIWALVDLLLIGFGKLKAKDDNRPLEGYEKNRSWVKIIVIIMAVFNAVILVGIIIMFALSTALGIQGKVNSNDLPSGSIYNSTTN
jgi:hypothetical protein